MRKGERMLYMVIERYPHGPGPAYERAAARGRMLTDGLSARLTLHFKVS